MTKAGGYVDETPFRGVSSISLIRRNLPPGFSAIAALIELGLAVTSQRPRRLIPTALTVPGLRPGIVWPGKLDLGPARRQGVCRQAGHDVAIHPEEDQRAIRQGCGPPASLSRDERNGAGQFIAA